MAKIKTPPIKAQSPSDFDRGDILEKNFLSYVSTPQTDPIGSMEKLRLSQTQYIDLFDSQLQSRHLDLLARELKQQGLGYYTIGSCGHEANAAVALAFRPTDIAFLHYRSAAFMLQRAKTIASINMPYDILLSLVASKEDPIAGGRHKVFGSLPLTTPPQTSTIASHLPKAVGTAASIKRASSLKIPHPLADDSVVLCSFGDASFNHASALCAFNSARWIAQSHYPLPLVFICEDNGWGVSVPTAGDWIQSSIMAQPWINYIQADGLDLNATYIAAQEAERMARVKHQPVFLHLKMVRLLGHAGTDFELNYRHLAEVEKDEANDPLLHSAKTLLQQHWLSETDIKQRYLETKLQLQKLSTKALKQQKLDCAEDVLSSIIPPPLTKKTPASPTESIRKSIFAEKYKKLNAPTHLAQQINLALTDILIQYKQAIIFGEDVGKKGGVYQITAGLQSRFGINRIFDTLLDETTILGQAIGHAHNGFIPIPEIQFLAYLHNAEDQLRGEAATLSFFSNGQFTNPMLIRIASFAYQKGFGGHFHNDNSIAVLRDIPGIIIATPSNGPDAVKMLRTCMQLANIEQRIIVFLEPIALYMQKDLHQPQDQQWLFPYPSLSETIPLGEIGVHQEGIDPSVAIISYGNGYYLSRQAAHILQKNHQISVKIIDLRWLAPLNSDAILREISSIPSLLIVDECRQTGSLAEQLQSMLFNKPNHPPHIQTLNAKDSFIPLGKAWQHVLPSKDDIVTAVLNMPIKR